MDPGSTEPSEPHQRFTRRAAEITAAGPARPSGDAIPDVTMVVDVYDEQDVEVAADQLGQLALFALGQVWARTPAMHALAPAEALHVDVTLVGADRMAELNHEHMGQPGPTDVLAFPLDAAGEGHEGVPAFVGDVVMSPAVAAVQAAAVGQALDHEMEMLLVHGILHLVGHDHAEDGGRRVMFGLTDEILEAFRSRPTAHARIGEAGS